MSGDPSPTTSPAVVGVATVVLACYGGFFVLLGLGDIDLLVIGVIVIGFAGALWWGGRVGYWIGLTGSALLTGLFVLGFVLDPDLVVGIVAVFAAVPLVLLLLPNARRTVKAPAERDSGDPSGLSPPEGWTRELAGGRVKFVLLALIFAGMLAFGVLMLIGGDLGVGGTMLAFGAAGLCVLPQFRSWRRRGRVTRTAVRVNGRPETGVSFPYPRSGAVSLLIGGFLMGLSCLGLLLFASEFADSGAELWMTRGIGGIGALFFGGGSILAFVRGGGRGWRVVLTPSSVYVQHGPARSVLRWESIADVDAFETSVHTKGGTVHEPFVRITATDAAAIRGDAFDQAVRQLVPSIADTVSLPTRGLGVDPNLLLYALSYYHAHPEARQELGQPAGLARIRRGELR